MMPIYPPHTIRLISEIDRARMEVRQWRSLAVFLWVVLIACTVIITLEYTI